MVDLVGVCRALAGKLGLEISAPCEMLVGLVCGRWAAWVLGVESMLLMRRMGF